MSQLLEKVKELEQTNARILQQQAETVNQLQAVQRDTEHISKAYEYLADSDGEDDMGEMGVLPGRSRMSSSMNSPYKFPSARKRVDSSRGHSSQRYRKSVAGLFGEGPSDHEQFPGVPFSNNSWLHDGYSRQRSLSMGNHDRPFSPAANFVSPQSDLLSELSPIGSRLTLDGELSMQLDSGNASWESEQRSAGWHLRSQSLSNLSQISVPASPSNQPTTPPNLDIDSQAPLADEFPKNVQEAPRTPSPQPMPGMLPQPDLQVEPPTPSSDRVFRPVASNNDPMSDLDEQMQRQLTMSPREEMISQRIRARKSRWEDERFGSLSSTTSIWGSPAGERKGFGPVFVPPQPTGSGATSLNAFHASSIGRSGTPVVKAPQPMRISTIVDNLVDQFAATSGGSRFLSVETPSREASPISDYEDAVSEVYEDANSREEDFVELDDEEDVEDGEDETMVNKTPQVSEMNALQLQVGPDYAKKGWMGSPSSTKSPRQRGSAENAHSEGSVLATKPTGSRWGSVLLELWLWLQFAIIVFVFLCAMAKKGPKAVLADAEQKTRTRKQSLRLKRM